MFTLNSLSKQLNDYHTWIFKYNLIILHCILLIALFVCSSDQNSIKPDINQFNPMKGSWYYFQWSLIFYYLSLKRNHLHFIYPIMAALWHLILNVIVVSVVSYFSEINIKTVWSVIHDILDILNGTLPHYWSKWYTFTP